ncbi:hypothetical protein NDU88_008126 [Pleurodeles waltl]|uniref:Uncharacterized protein n=1 Tax=Pleurodeles waltl TaxID=8319 RepID=A0AAV7RUV8_PLEWA|nr:hypothetical protein NDU88_008126 [Pleurodeles waltl]
MFLRQYRYVYEEVAVVPRVKPEQYFETLGLPQLWSLQHSTKLEIALRVFEVPHDEAAIGGVSALNIIYLEYAYDTIDDTILLD